MWFKQKPITKVLTFFYIINSNIAEWGIFYDVRNKYQIENILLKLRTKVHPCSVEPDIQAIVVSWHIPASSRSSQMIFISKNLL